MYTISTHAMMGKISSLMSCISGQVKVLSSSTQGEQSWEEGMAALISQQ